MASFLDGNPLADLEGAFNPTKKKHKKSKKMKREKKDKATKSQQWHVNDEVLFSQWEKLKKIKAKKPDASASSKTSKQRPKKPLTEPIIIHSTESEKEQKRSKKRVAFILPPEEIHTPKLHAECFYSSPVKQASRGRSDKVKRKKQLPSESSMESNTAEELNSQDLFITQKTFLEPHLELSSSHEAASQPETPSKSEASTQTENFFTFPDLHIRIRQQDTISCVEEALDLSLPTRARGAHGQNVPKCKASDTSSEDSDAAYKVKGDVSQLKVVQTRLNESFFFKVKGDDSPKPISPLMKLTLSEKKPRK